MSQQFSDTTNHDGLIQRIERGLGYANGVISGNSTLLAQYTAELNLAMDYAWGVIFEVAYQWQPDDSNHTDYPILFFNLVSGQRDYSFTADEGGNKIVDILKVAAKDSGGTFKELKALDQQSRSSNNYDVSEYIDGNNTAGSPTSYDKTGTGLFLNPVPNYNSTNGLKVFVLREESYFTTADTTKTPGFVPSFHEYPALRVIYKQAVIKRFENLDYLRAEMLDMEQKIRNHYGRRDRDAVRRMMNNVEDSR